MKKVVVIGGGTGVFTVLSGLKEYEYELSAIVTMADDGGSTGILREEFGVLPPGDIRRALVALSSSDNKIVSDLFNYRFDSNSSLHGHSLGNLLLTALEKITGNINLALKEAVTILNVKGEVVPVTLEKTKLNAELEDGKVIEGESNIDIPKHDPRLKIKKVFLSPPAKANKYAVKTIMEANYIILGPGDLYTSIIPNLLVQEIVPALKRTHAQIIYVVNIMTKYGETNKFQASDFIRVIEEYLGEGVLDYAVVNVEKMKGEILQRYKEENVDYVEYDKEKFNSKPKILTGKFLRKGHFLRHDQEKLAKTLSKIIGR
ncbi:MAG: hypothetical protein A3C27_00315 [Candidatus Levybacteria bacterium RIFCSPHIGHO2_02_FULL_39_36]|nr:MAG: hypothetical protein UT20_C0015G0014 [Candidatus Levybacteria bacterium GW2011_GWA1_39_11]KKR24796.1 MAG: hypothetical protein UT56_C0008G0013 [Candidatus Levybacteria bacterium GW2011_GWB1_39_7]KKR27266.1 MAG: protein of unknown function UPF0052 and CofD [Microgenomates group bacterium GW2011_GWC1_39_7]KKR49568.1 MAG: hypothetical protein UT85_C0015G0003 [Candidatus Levybacteria bacterium GW2011_GWA2_40_16]OGH15566.1 MAG: hypothetical protein A2689_03115 [Candidatus Levybacteria bacter